MLEDMAKGFVAAARFLLHWIVWSFVLFNLGRGALLLVTFGRYPRSADVERDADRISLVGFFVLFLAWSLIAIYNNTVGVHG